MMWRLLGATDNPMMHVVDHPMVTTEDGRLALFSNHIAMMLLAALLLILFVPRVVRSADTGEDVESMTPRGPRNALEAICAFLRDFVAKPNMGPHTDRFVPYIWSVFFFILTLNLLGLVPLGPVTAPLTGLVGHDHGIYGAATGNIWVTGTLATCTMLMIFVNGLRLHGLSYVQHFFMGPFPINLLIGFLEITGVLVKCVALALRLFANMVAGHILLAVLLGFIFMAGAAGLATALGVAAIVVLGSVAVTLLEIFVAFLQAFIFTFLSAVFIGQAVNVGHEVHGEPADHVKAQEEAALEH